MLFVTFAPTAHTTSLFHHSCDILVWNLMSLFRSQGDTFLLTLPPDFCFSLDIHPPPVRRERCFGRVGGWFAITCLFVKGFSCRITSRCWRISLYSTFISHFYPSCTCPHHAASISSHNKLPSYRWQVTRYTSKGVFWMQGVSSYLTPFLSLHTRHLQLQQVVQCLITLCGILSVERGSVFENVLVLLWTFFYGEIYIFLI